ncbi:MAG: type II secretion system F family protein [Candidatus Omnitrophota bacterium]
MPSYIYTAKKGPQEIINGRIEASSQEEAVNSLIEAGLFPLEVIDARGRVKANRYLRQVVIKRRDADIFIRQLSSLLRSGVRILNALYLIAQQTENRNLQDVVFDLAQQIKEGASFSEALSKYKNIFDNLCIGMIKTGEKGGVLDKVLLQLVEYRQAQDETRRKLQLAMAYPLFILAAGVATVFIMLIFFLPKLTVVFKGLNQELPLPTQILINLSNFSSANWHWFLIFSVLLIVVFARLKSSGRKKFLLDIIKLRIPLIKKFILNSEIARFSRALAMLLKNGISVQESLSLATEALDNQALKNKLYLAKEAILSQGTAFWYSFQKINIFPVFVINMIAVGEESGKLADSLLEIADTYEREVEQQIKIITSLLEPVLVLAVGLVIGFIVFAMLLPIFNINVIAK